MFRVYLKQWEDDLEEWTRWCKQGAEERRTLQATGGLVSQASPASQRTPNPALSDASRVPGPPGLSRQAEDRTGVLQKRAEKCARAIAEIEKVISLLKEAERSGEWAGQSTQTYAIFKEKKWISPVVARVSRGESVEVREIQGDWWRVRTKKGVEGWSQRATVAPQPPVRLWLLKDGKSVQTADPIDRSGANQAGRG